MEREFYYIEEEFFSEDSNDSSWYVLDDFIFTGQEEAIQYLEGYFTKNDFQLMEKRDFYGEKCCYVITDRSFPEKYSSSLGESYEKYFLIRKLMLHK